MLRTFVIGAAGVLLVALVLFVIVGVLAPRQAVVQHRRFIAAEPPEVWAVITEYGSWPALLQGERGAREVTDIQVDPAEGGGEGTERTIRFKDGDVWRDLVTVYEPPYDLRFSGEDTPGVGDWQNHILLEPGARGGTVATHRVSFEPEGFFSRVLTQVYFAPLVRHHVIQLLDNVAERLGAGTMGVDEYALREAQQRAREAVDQQQAGTDAGTPDAGPEDAAPEGLEAAPAP